MNKGKGNKKRKTEETEHNIFQKGVDGRKPKKKWNCEREDKRKTRTKQNKRKEGFQRQTSWGHKKKKTTLKLQENNLCGAVSKQKTKTQRNNKTIKKTKTNERKHLLACWQTTPIFCKFMFFFDLHSFISARLCCAENTIKQC